jgi:hypothetical protein
MTLTVVFSSSLGGGVLGGTDGFALLGQQVFSWLSSSSTPIMKVGTSNCSGRLELA